MVLLENNPSREVSLANALPSNETDKKIKSKIKFLYFELLHFESFSAVLGINDPNPGLKVGGGFCKLTQ